MKRGFLIGLAILFSFLIASCQQVAEKATEKAIEKATGVQVADGAVPAELKDFPVPSGFTYGGGGSISKDGDKMTTASWTGQSTPAEVEAFFKKEMPGRGWKEESVMNTDSGSLLSYSKADQTGVMITVSKEDNGEITIAVILGKSSNKPTPTAESESVTAAEAPEATPTIGEAEPTPTPAAPETDPSANIAPQLKAIPLPSGFQVEKDSFETMNANGKLAMASARWFGKTDAKQSFEFFKKEIPAAGWTELFSTEDSDGFTLTYNGKDELNLAIQIRMIETGTEIEMVLLPD